MLNVGFLMLNVCAPTRYGTLEKRQFVEDALRANAR